MRLLFTIITYCSLPLGRLHRGSGVKQHCALFVQPSSKTVVGQSMRVPWWLLRLGVCLGCTAGTPHPAAAAAGFRQWAHSTAGDNGRCESLLTADTS